MDEILTVWTCRLPSISRINWALLHGVQFQPPGHLVMLHLYSSFAGGSNLALRIPSIAAVVLTGFVVYFLFQRFLGTEPAIFAACLTLESLSIFGLQVRPYSLVTLCFAGALFLWNDLNLRPSIRRAALIGFLLAFSISLNFICVLFVVCFGLMEIFRFVRTQDFRPWLWLSLTLAGLSILLWFPFAHGMTRFAHEDVAGSSAYPWTPTLSALISTYGYLFLGSPSPIFRDRMGLTGALELFALILIGAAGWFQKIVKQQDADRADSVPSARTQSNDFWLLILGTLSIPLLVFAFGSAVTKTYYLRYAVGGTLGASALITDVLNAFPPFKRIVVPATLVFASVLNVIWGVPSMEFRDQSDIYKAMPGPYPIVVADSCLFFSFEESAPAEFRSRMVYLTIPSNFPVMDAQCANAITRWKVINASLPVEDSARFLRDHATFYLLDEQTNDHSPGRYLLSIGTVLPWKELDGTRIYRSHPESPESPEKPEYDNRRGASILQEAQRQ